MNTNTINNTVHMLQKFPLHNVLRFSRLCDILVGLFSVCANTNIFGTGRVNNTNVDTPGEVRYGTVQFIKNCIV